MRKLEAWKVGGVQRGKKTTFCDLESCFFLLAFSLLLFICTSKMISEGWDSTLIALKVKHSPWRSKEVIQDGQIVPYLLFFNSIHKTKFGTANRWETPIVIGNHMEQSLWFANEKQVPEIRSYLLHSWHVRTYLGCTNYAKMLGHTTLSSALCVLHPILMCRVPYWALLGYSYSIVVPTVLLRRAFQSVTGLFSFNFVLYVASDRLIIHEEDFAKFG